jgi:hypothetical protein
MDVTSEGKLMFLTDGEYEMIRGLLDASFSKENIVRGVMAMQGHSDEYIDNAMAIIKSVKEKFRSEAQ